MKKMLQFIIVCILFIPLLVNAETCDNDKISISSITVADKSNNVEELSEATVKGRNINLNLNMSAVGDKIDYDITVNNNSYEDYIIDDSTFNLNSDYIDYTIESKDNSNIVKAKSSKTVNLRISYNKKVPSNQFNAGKFDNSSTMTVNLSTNNLLDMITNPNTGSLVLLFILLIITIGVVYTIIIKKKKLRFLILIVGLLLIVPISVYAACKVEIKINSNIQIVNKGYMPCTFDGEMVPGAEFAYGDFIYRYKQEHTMIKENMWNWHREWVDIDEDGWGVIHKDIKSRNVTGEYTPRICSSINGKPIVSMSYTFYMMSKIEKLDVSYIDTSNVTNMDNTFYYVGGDVYPETNENNDLTFSIVGLENWDVSNVENMEEMFSEAGRFAWNVVFSDFSNWDTSKVKTMRSMFTLVGQGVDAYNLDDRKSDVKCDIRGIENWDVSSVEDMSFMFENFGSGMEKIYFDFSNWDVSNVKEFDGTFLDTGFFVDSVELRGLDKWDVSNGINFSYMFEDLGYNADSIIIDNVTNWDVSNVENMEEMFELIGEMKSTNISFGNLSNWNTKNVKNMKYMFSDIGNENTNIIDIGTLNIYADNIDGIFKDSFNIKGELNIYSAPILNNNNWYYPFKNAATKEGSLITVNYSRNTTNIDDIISTKSENSNVVKGRLLD